MESSQEKNDEKPEEKVIDNEQLDKSQADNVPDKPVSVAGQGTTMSSAPKPKETKKPPKKQARRKNKD